MTEAPATASPSPLGGPARSRTSLASFSDADRNKASAFAFCDLGTRSKGRTFTGERLSAWINTSLGSFARAKGSALKTLLLRPSYRVISGPVVVLAIPKQFPGHPTQFAAGQNENFCC